MSDNRYLEILECYANNSLTLSELEELKQYWMANDTDALKESIASAFERKVYSGLSDKARADEIFNSIMSSAKQAEGFVLRKKRIWFAAAAITAFVISFGGLFFASNNKVNSDNISTLTPDKDILPGNSKAVLTLANGKKILLNDGLKGLVAKEGNVSLVKDGGELSYQSSKQTNVSLSYNTVSTPRGGMYELVLSDGTKVWLDAASSLKYPTSFVGAERKVELEGEAYFEVAHNKKMPFRVVAKEMTVEVLGTHFNVNAYADEASSKTTLIEGSVKIVANNETTLLTPGRSARIRHAGLVVEEADVEQELAWKNGYFIFNKAGIVTIMRQLSRWYDVDVSYAGTVPDNVFVGQIKREETLVGALKILELSGIHFRIEGRKVIVL